MRTKASLAAVNACLLSVLLMFNFSTPLMAQTLLNVKDLPASNVTLTPSTSADFSTQVSALIGTPSADLSSLLPYSVILRNLTGQTIRGYALRWTYIDQQGNQDANYQVEQNFDFRQKGAEISPGGGSLLSPFGPIAPPTTSSTGSALPVPPGALTKLAKCASITITLDAVAFDDGKVIGPNEGFAMNIWGSMYAAQRDVGLAVLQRSLTSSPNDLINWLTSQSTQPEVHRQDASIQERLAGSSHWYQMYARMAAERLLEFGKQSSDVMTAEARRLAQTPTPTCWCNILSVNSFLAGNVISRVEAGIAG